MPTLINHNLSAMNPRIREEEEEEAAAQPWTPCSSIKHLLILARIRQTSVIVISMATSRGRLY